MDKNYRYFLMIAQSGSFKKASERLFISQPSLTVAIKKLENDIGVTLFHRHAKGVELTDYGILLKEHVLQQQDKHFQFVHQIEDMKQRVHGKIKLGTGEAWWELLVKQIISQYQTNQPGSSFHLEFGNNQALVHHLVQNELDLVVGHEIIGLSEDVRVSFCPLFQENEAIYVKTNHPLLADEHYADQLARYPLIRVTPTHSRHLAVLAAENARQSIIYEQERILDRVCYDIDSLAASIDMLNMTEAVMPYTDKMQHWLKQKGIETLAINKKQIGNVGVYTKYGVKNEKVALFIELLQQAVQQWQSD